MGTDLISQYGILKSTRILRTFQFSLMIPGVEFDHILVSATSFPGREVTDIELPIGGTTVKYPGPPVYNDSWTVTFRDDADLYIRKQLDEFMGPVAFFDPTLAIFQEQRDITVMVEDSTGAPTKIVLKNAYISKIGEVTMDYGNDAIATYDVTFNYHMWEFK